MFREESSNQLILRCCCSPDIRESPWYAQLTVAPSLVIRRSRSYPLSSSIIKAGVEVIDRRWLWSLTLTRQSEVRQIVSLLCLFALTTMQIKLNGLIVTASYRSFWVAEWRVNSSTEQMDNGIGKIPLVKKKNRASFCALSTIPSARFFAIVQLFSTKA